MSDPITLEGLRVRLEPMSLLHLDALTAAGLEPSLWQWANAAVRTPEEMRAYVENAIRAREAGAEIPFVTIDKASSQVAGSTRYMNIELAHKRLEVGSTWVSPAFQRTWINTEAKYLMFRHAFETLGCNRVELKTDALNMRSRAAIVRAGAVEEGTLRRHMVTATGRIRDSVYFSVIAEEWPAVKAMLEQRMRA